MAMLHHATANPTSVAPALKISEVADQSGVSKELIHHYVRQGLVPKSPARGLYTPEQVRLLRQIRLLREEHHLPLETIRQVFEVFEFDLGRIESLTLSESLGRRMMRLASNPGRLHAPRIPAGELLRRTGIGSEHLAEYRESRLVEPLEEGGEALFTGYDAKIIGLCERGMELGISFESFQTIASYIRIAFELEQQVFFGAQSAFGTAGEHLLGELFVRRELVGSFVQNVLHNLTEHRFRETLGEGAVTHFEPDGIIYRPSRAFVARHGLGAAVDEALIQLSEEPDSPGQWRRAAALLLHTGRYHEAVFFLEQAVRKWKGDPILAAAHGKAALLVGDLELAMASLQRALDLDPQSAVAHICLALALFGRDRAGGHPEQALTTAGTILAHVENALSKAAKTPGEELEIQAFGGWVYTAMPSVLGTRSRGLQLLVRVLRALQGRGASTQGRTEKKQREKQAALKNVGGKRRNRPPDASSSLFPPVAFHGSGSRELPPEKVPLSGLSERRLINTAYLLFEALTRTGSSPLASEMESPSLDELRRTICLADPGSAFAESVYLKGELSRD